MYRFDFEDDAWGWLQDSTTLQEGNDTRPNESQD